MTLVTKAYAEAIAKERGEAIDQIVKLSFETPPPDKPVQADAKDDSARRAPRNNAAE